MRKLWRNPKGKAGLVICVLLMLFLASSWSPIEALRPNALRGNQSSVSANESKGNEGRPAKNRQRKNQDDKEVKFLAGPDYQLFSDDGSVNSNLLSLAGIKAERAEELKDLIDETWTSVGKKLEARAAYLEEESDPGKDVRVYFIPADKSAAISSGEAFKSSLESNFGSAAARVFSPYAVNEGFLGAFGMYDIKLKLKPGSSQGEPTLDVTYITTDPATGDLVASGSMSTPEAYKARFANMFLKPKESR